MARPASTGPTSSRVDSGVFYGVVGSGAVVVAGLEVVVLR
jgi:hypothetical protein